MENGFYNDKKYKEYFRVTVFGSARIEEEDEVYKSIFELARRVASKEIDIVTGGGPGLMQAANAGHKACRRNGKSKSIGLNIKLPKEQDSNRHLDIKREFDRFSQRLDNFMMLSNIVVVAPGGIGTILELFYTWQLVQVKHVNTIPIILFGDMWRDLISWVNDWPLKKKFLDDDDLDFVFIAETVDDVMEIIDACHMAHLTGKDMECAKMQAYRF